MKYLWHNCLPEDGLRGTLVGRLWVPGPLSGPRVVTIRKEGAVDLSGLAPTMSDLLEMDAVAIRVATHSGETIASVDAVLAGSYPSAPQDTLRLLAPCDLQCIKAAGVTFAASLLERVIEERAAGDPARAAEVRAYITRELGTSLAGIKPGSAAAQQIKATLIASGVSPLYLEVGLGPDAEIFTKAPPLSAVGHGAELGVHPQSTWNNPEPELVVAISSSGRIVGATLGNDVNLRDFEGRSALLVARAKDNNASAAIGPFIRLFDTTFCLDHVRQAEARLRVEGRDGYVLDGVSLMSEISRDPTELVEQTIGPTHQYPDGVMLYCGTLFAPTQDRDIAGHGFTHKIGDRVSVSSPLLGTLANEITTSDQAAPWTYGVRSLMRHLAARGLLR